MAKPFSVSLSGCSRRRRFLRVLKLLKNRLATQVRGKIEVNNLNNPSNEEKLPILIIDNSVLTPIIHSA